MYIIYVVGKTTPTMHLYRFVQSSVVTSSSTSTIVVVQVQ